jgi:hypothetical protein
VSCRGAAAEVRARAGAGGVRGADGTADSRRSFAATVPEQGFEP